MTTFFELIGICALIISAVSSALIVALAIYGQRLQSRPPSVMRVNYETNIAHVCAWCQSAKQGDQWAKLNKLVPSHGICRTHAKSMAGESN